ncbi:isoamyl acetate-hydrolyzing esterase [Coemansia sp. RSA 1933]|nr:isoamyl acetate-hydrolyzing esterase [Coemansia sp. RSA 1933]
MEQQLLKRRVLLYTLAAALIIGLTATRIVFIVLFKKGNAHASSITASLTQSNTYEYPMYDVALAFGDSITQRGFEYENSGWLIHLSEMYTRRMDILNRGFSSYNTSRARLVADIVFPMRRNNLDNVASVNEMAITSEAALRRRASTESKWPSTDSTFPEYYPNVQLCTLFFGANDAVDPRDSRYVSLNEYSDNLEYLVNMLQDPNSDHYSPTTRIVIITPPAVGNVMSAEAFKNRGYTYAPQNNSLAQTYAEAAINVAKSRNLPYIDMWTAVEQLVEAVRQNATLMAGLNSDYDGYDAYLVDGLHLNSNGNELLFDLLSGTIESNWPEFTP